ncbi:uncharacterized protein Z520_02920 [Fonsecaea multimorphosa CBS 102226]|uniref:DUF302 domain-containing protein n=1 Tax=Fonsecaea multimorphosa CBS 102226 TaxID=1442371 RepID=A0A0D2K6B2_9EURO|nr:uncharacterized protein Z520_02920 [Fonsecaea multimorphosa CBS 102226]KIY01368.1 hypothetical protein Z520_02920 [Fonsecaea multimorphosa CBS 102226]OAL28644.1 hypothetical protein AYO22_02838 [Fonsecaea multimorphosa]
MTLTTERQTIQAERLVYHSSISFSLAESRLRSSIQSSSPSKGQQGQAQIRRPTDRESHDARIKSLVGPHGFMYFHEFNHGAWLPFYAPPSSTITTVDGETKNLNCKRFILGNPLIAITMLEHDLNAGLCVPVELGLVEEPQGGVRIVWYKPTSLIAGYEGAKQELVDAANVLSTKLEALVRWVLRDEEGEGKL